MSSHPDRSFPFFLTERSLLDNLAGLTIIIQENLNRHFTVHLSLEFYAAPGFLQLIINKSACAAQSILAKRRCIKLMPRRTNDFYMNLTIICD